jgi:phthiocerol/phenolphthiocerol synthesis type-I polyketide synthase E
MSLRDDHVAVVGLACRPPGAGDLEEFWDNLVNGVESVEHFSAEEMRDFGVDERDLEDETYIRVAAFTPELEGFDAGFFGMTPREAAIRDPQHRLFMECLYSALSHAGYDPARIPVSVGVFGGSTQNKYADSYVKRNRAVTRAAGSINVAVSNHADYLATIASYKLGFTGPSISIQTACSTSLVAIHLACQSLRSGECDLAVAGGVEIELPYQHGYNWMEGSIFSQVGHVRPFDADADGTIFASGGGAVVLKLLGAALEDGDTIYAVVRGSAVNNDGNARAGFTAPGIDGQTALVVEALADAEIEADSIGFVEAHGTGTAVGDPIEVTALTRAYRTQTDRVGYCTIGSVKGNVGHLGPGAGVIGFIKAVLALDRECIPPTANYVNPNPALELETTPFTINSEPRRWSRNGGRRRAAVSSFGIGGTNAHAILEEAPALPPTSEPSRLYQLLPIAARTDSALERVAEQLADHLEAHPEQDVADVAATLQAGRGEHDIRRFVVAESKTDAIELLRGGGPRGHAGGGRAAETRVAFLFSGQGSQYPGMGAGLYTGEPVYREAIDRCSEILEPALGLDLRTLLHAAPDAEAGDRLAQTAITQPALFAVEWALAELWASLGVEPAAMLGHSIGEYVAATRAGVFSLADGLRLVAARGQLMQACEPGAMLALPLGADAVRPLLNGSVALAVSNAPASCVVSGIAEAIESFRAELAQMGIEGRPLVTSHAFHSPLMEPALRPFADLVCEVSRQEPTKPYLSNLTGTWATAEQACDPEYWALHLRSEVKFSAGVQELLADPELLLLEVGPGQVLTTLVRQHGEPRICVSSLRHPQQAGDDQALLLAALGKLWASGLAVDWQRLRAGETRRRVPLPSYPYERQRCWVDPDPGSNAARDADALEGSKPALEAPLLVPTWSEHPEPQTERADGEVWLVLVEQDEQLGAALVEAAEAAGASVVTAFSGHAFDEGYDGLVLDPESVEDCTRLLDALAETGRWPDRILHALTAAGGAAADPLDVSRVEDEVRRGFGSLLALMQAIGRRGGDERIPLLVVTDSMQRVFGVERLAPGQASVLGPILVVGREMPRIDARSIDVMLDGRPLDETARAVVAEALLDHEDRQVALRDRRRWVLGYAEIPQQTAGAADALRERGVYMISGGLGGLGLEIAHDFARVARARLALLGRRNLPPREEWDAAIAAGHERASTLEKLRQIEADGGEVLTYAVDVNDLEALTEVVADVRRRFGVLNGVVHAAGVPGGGMLVVRKREDADAVLTPKVRGTLTLLEACGDDLDFFAGFASIIGVSGDFGQVDYGAANSVLDRIAHARTGSPAYTVSIDWAGWSQVGMLAAAGDAAYVNRKTEDVSHPILRTLTRGGEDELELTFTLDPDGDWFLDEHRFEETAVLPGTAYVELARAAMQAATGSTTIEIADVIFIGPLTVPAETECRIIFRRNGDWWSFSVERAGEGGYGERARGRARVHAEATPPPVDLAERRARCVNSVDMSEGSSLMTFGAHWTDTVRRLQRTDDLSESLLEIALGDGLADDIGDLWLHPSLLDIATAFGTPAPDADYLPFGYRRAVVHRPMPAHCIALRVHKADATNEEFLENDVVVVDDEGNVCVEIQGYGMRRAERERIRNALLAEDAGEAATSALEGRVRISSETRLANAEGVEIFRRILAARPGPQVVVCPEGFERRLARIGGITSDALASGPTVGMTAATGERFLTTPYVEPEGELEQLLAELWGEALGLREVGAEDDFFDLGGSSLIAVQLLARIRDRLNIDVGIAVVFESPTVSLLAAGIERQLVEYVAGLSDEQVEQALELAQ